MSLWNFTHFEDLINNGSKFPVLKILIALLCEPLYELSLVLIGPIPQRSEVQVRSLAHEGTQVESFRVRILRGVYVHATEATVENPSTIEG